MNDLFTNMTNALDELRRKEYLENVQKQRLEMILEKEKKKEYRKKLSFDEKLELCKEMIEKKEKEKSIIRESRTKKALKIQNDYYKSNWTNIDRLQLIIDAKHQLEKEKIRQKGLVWENEIKRKEIKKQKRIQKIKDLIQCNGWGYFGVNVFLLNQLQKEN